MSEIINIILAISVGNFSPMFSENNAVKKKKTIAKGSDDSRWFLNILRILNYKRVRFNMNTL